MLQLIHRVHTIVICECCVLSYLQDQLSFLMVLAGDLGVDHMRVREQVQHHITLHNEVSMTSLPTTTDSHALSSYIIIIYVLM